MFYPLICALLFNMTYLLKSNNSERSKFPEMLFHQCVGEVWNYFSNFGYLGGELNYGYYGMSWPVGLPCNNYYLWQGYFAVGAKVAGDYYVTTARYNLREWYPSDDSPDSIIWGGLSDLTILVHWDDFLDNPYNQSGRHLGIKCLVRSLSWNAEPYNDFIIYEVGVTYDSSLSDIPGHGEAIDSVFIGFCYDCDVSGADISQPNIDDLVDFDGWVNGEWQQFGYPYDSLTILPDSFYDDPDGYFDQYIVFGDNAYEHTIRGDTQIIPRNLSYMYDWDNPEVPGNDIGENGASEGFIGVAMLYAPFSPADSVWVDEFGDTLRIPRVFAHQWWNWEWVPSSDYDFYFFLSGQHPMHGGLRYAPNPLYEGAEAYDYTFLQSSGPYTLHNNDTLWFVYVAAVGQKLSGGYDYYYGRGWLRGLRQTIDYALAFYYQGSVNSDPYHPSGPREDVHWGATGVTEEECRKEVNLFSLKSNIVGSDDAIELSVKNPGSFDICLYDISGRRINKWRKKTGNSPQKNFVLRVKDVPPGVYFLICEDDENEKQVFKLIKLER